MKTGDFWIAIIIGVMVVLILTGCAHHIADSRFVFPDAPVDVNAPIETLKTIPL